MFKYLVPKFEIYDTHVIAFLFSDDWDNNINFINFLENFNN